MVAAAGTESLDQSPRLPQRFNSNVSLGDFEYSRSRQDSTDCLSAAKCLTAAFPDQEQPPEHHGSEHHRNTSYPIPLLIFVSLLAIFCGLLAVGLHLTITYAGCPLGINNCNPRNGKEDKAFWLIRAIHKLSPDIPEGIIYVMVAALGAAAIGGIWLAVPEYIAFQLRGGGTVQSLVAVASGRPIPTSACVLRVLTTCIYLGCCGTLGGEGAAIHVCTGITTQIGWWAGMRSQVTQSLLASLGLAGGFSATFNSPIAGIMFAMEELSHMSTHMSKALLAVILLTSITSTSVARAMYSSYLLLDPRWSDVTLNSSAGGSFNRVFGGRMWMLIAVPIGVLCAFVGFVITVGLRRLRAFVLTRMAGKADSSVVLVLVLQALCSACVGWAVFRMTGLRGVWGVGAESMQEAFDQDIGVFSFFCFGAGKALAMMMAIAVRAPGDSLEPVLIIGAFLGGSVGCLVRHIVEEDIKDDVVGPCLLFGMVGLFATCFRQPLTPVVIAMEFTGINTYALVLPTLLCSFVSITVADRYMPPLLIDMLLQDGIDLGELAQTDWDDAPDLEEGVQPECFPDHTSNSSRSSTLSEILLASIQDGMRSLVVERSNVRTRSSSRSNTKESSICISVPSEAPVCVLAAAPGVGDSRSGSRTSSRTPSVTHPSGLEHTSLPPLPCADGVLPVPSAGRGRKLLRPHTYDGNMAMHLKFQDELPRVATSQSIKPSRCPGSASNSGHDVEVAITPIVTGFPWEFSDGETSSTPRSGRPGRAAANSCVSSGIAEGGASSQSLRQGVGNVTSSPAIRDERSPRTPPRAGGDNVDSDCTVGVDIVVGDLAAVTDRAGVATDNASPASAAVAAPGVGHGDLTAPCQPEETLERQVSPTEVAGDLPVELPGTLCLE